MGLLPSPYFVNENHSHNDNHSQLADFPNFAMRIVRTSQTSQTLQSVNENHSRLETL
jgi:hypothetical protein